MQKKTAVELKGRAFDILGSAFLVSKVALVDCIDAKTQEHVAVICLMAGDGKMIPVARMLPEDIGESPKNLIPPADPKYQEVVRTEPRTMGFQPKAQEDVTLN